MAVLLLYPLGATVYYSFCDFSMQKPPMPIGLANYVDLFHDEVFLKAIQNTLTTPSNRPIPASRMAERKIGPA